MEEQLQPVKRASFVKKIWLLGIILLLVGLTACGFLIWRAAQPHSLLPSYISKQVETFKPYFFREEVPVGYSFDQNDISFTNQVLLVPLKKPGAPTVMLTEQPLPNDLPADLQQEKDKVHITWGSATISKLGDKWVVTVLTYEAPKTLILLSTPDTGSSADLASLLQALHPVE